MTRWIRRKIDDETEKLIIDPEEKKKKARLALGRLNQEEIARALAYASYTSFLVGSIIWVVMHATALALQRDKMLAIRKDILLAGYISTILAYVLHLSCVAMYVAKIGEQGLSKKKVDALEIAATVSESAIALAVASLSIKMLFSGEKSTLLIPILGGVASMFSIAASAALLYRIGRTADTIKPARYKVQVSMRMLAMLLSATNVCLVISILVPSAQMTNVGKETVQLVLSAGWALAFIGAIILMRTTPRECRIQTSSPSNCVDTTPIAPENMLGDLCNSIPSNSVSM